MKKKTHMQWAARAMALAVTGSVLLGGGAAAAVPVFAAAVTEDSVIKNQPDKGSIQIYKHTGKGDTAKPLAGVTFKVYRVMELVPGAAAGKFASFQLNENFKDVFPGLTKDQLGNFSAAEIEAKAGALAAKAKTLKDGGTEAVTNENGIADFNNLPLGYYLVVEDTAPAGYFPVNPFLVSVPSTNDEGTAWDYSVRVEPKNETIPFEKTFADPKETGTAKVGDAVEFKIDTTIPEYQDEYFTAPNKVTFSIHDIMADGLTMLQDQAHPVKVQANTGAGGALQEVVAGEKTYTLTVKDQKTGEKTRDKVANSDFDLVVDFHQDFINANRGRQIVVTYYGQINDQAVIGAPGNLNDARLTYTHKPGSEGNTQTKWDDEKVYTFAVDLMKFAKKAGADTPLAGAQFALYSDETLKTQVGKTLTTDKGGKLAFGGLDEGIYFLKEVKAPEGYTLLANPIRIRLEAVEADGRATGEVDVFVNGSKIEKIDGVYVTHIENGKAHMAVENKEGFSLPSTGGAGILLFITVGVAGIAAVSAVTMRRTRR